LTLASAGVYLIPTSLVSFEEKKARSSLNLCFDEMKRLVDTYPLVQRFHHAGVVIGN